jgi:hypothetical protein
MLQQAARRFLPIGVSSLQAQAACGTKLGLPESSGNSSSGESQFNGTGAHFLPVSQHCSTIAPTDAPQRVIY